MCVRPGEWSSVDRDPEPYVARRRVRFGTIACRRSVSPAVRLVAEIRAAAHHSVRARVGSTRILARALAVVADVVPVLAPLPDVAGNVVQTEGVGRERVDRRRTDV